MSGKVLLVEDDRLLLHILKEKLLANQVEVVAAHDGIEALAELERNTINLIVLDLIMPHMDGFAFLELLRKDNRWLKVQVLVISNLGQENEITKAMNLGATDYIIKANIQINDLVEKVTLMNGAL